jgi:hypothetical protein
MKIHFNHHISCIGDIVSMMREAHPSVTITASHARRDSSLVGLLEEIIPEMPEGPGGAMPEGYVAWLMDMARGNQADVVIPYRHRQALSSHAGDFAQRGIRLLTCGTSDVMALIEDKCELLAFADARGMPISRFRSWSDLNALDASLSEFSDLSADKLCIKPAEGIYGTGFRRLYDETAPDAFSRALADGHPSIGIEALRSMVARSGELPRMMTMPYLPGRERSVDFACLDGKLLGAVTREKRGAVQLVGYDPVATGFAEVLAQDLNLSGLVNLQTLEDATGQQRLLEVNSRAAGGIGMTRYSGVNLPGLLLSALMGDLPSTPQYPVQGVEVARRQIYEIS